MERKLDHSLLKALKGTVCCNCQLDCGNDVIFHHIVPLSLGGNDVKSNIIPLCEDCHNLIHQKQSNPPLSHSELTKRGIEKARAEGKQIGLKAGTHLTTKKSLLAKKLIFKFSSHFCGTLNNNDCMKYVNVARNTFYKYIREMYEEIENNPELPDFTHDI